MDPRDRDEAADAIRGGWSASCSLPNRIVARSTPRSMTTSAPSSYRPGGRRCGTVIVVSEKQRRLLVAVRPFADIVDVERDRRPRDRKAAAEDVDQRGGYQRHLYSGGRVLKPAHRRLRTEIAPAHRRTADRQHQQRICAQVVAIVGDFMPAGDRELAPPKHRPQRVDQQRRFTRFPDAAGRRFGQAKRAFSAAQ